MGVRLVIGRRDAGQFEAGASRSAEQRVSWLAR